MWLFSNQNRFKTTSSDHQIVVGARPHPSRVLRIPSKQTQYQNDPSSKSSPQPDKMVIILRSDLKLSTRRAAEYAATVAVELAQKTCRSKHSCRAWKQAKHKCVVLNAPSRQSFLDTIAFTKTFKVFSRLFGARGDPHVAFAIFGQWRDVDHITKDLKSH